MARFEFPEMKIDRDRMVMFRTPLPNRGEAQMQAVIKEFAQRGKVEDLGSRIVVRDRKSVLEIFQASDSLRWMRETKESELTVRGVSLPKEDRAIELAQSFLKEHNLGDKQAAVSSVSYNYLSRMNGKGEKDPDELPAALNVNFGFSLDSLPVLGPGAKMQVTFGNRASVTQAYKFWRQPKVDREMAILKPENAAEILQRDPAYSDLSDNESHVKFVSVRLGYYALPPREVQNYLMPVYAFDGVVSTPFLKRYAFTKYVAAIETTVDEVKRPGAILRTPVAVF